MRNNTLTVIWILGIFVLIAIIIGFSLCYRSQCSDTTLPLEVAASPIVVAPIPREDILPKKEPDRAQTTTINLLNINDSFNNSFNHETKKYLNDDVDLPVERGLDEEPENSTSDRDEHQTKEIEIAPEETKEEATNRKKTSSLLSSKNTDRLEAGDRVSFTIGDVVFAFRYAPPGSFIMGSPTSELNRRDDEVPHLVTIPYGMLVFERKVSRRQFNKILSAKDKGTAINDDQPILGICARDAEVFCRELSRRLPRELKGMKLALPFEEEWEYACCSGNDGCYPWGDKWRADAVEQPNNWGLVGMVGVAFEFCANSYREYQNDKVVVDPILASSGKFRVIRGGSDDCAPEFCRRAYRAQTGFLTRSSEYSFRPIIRLDEEAEERLARM